MKFEVRELEIEMIPETEFDRDILERIHRAGSVEIKDGKTTDGSYPPADRLTNVILAFPDPNKWGP